MLVFPKMDIETPGEGVMARKAGTVTSITESKVVVDDVEYTFNQKTATGIDDSDIIILPVINSWQEPGGCETTCATETGCQRSAYRRCPRVLKPGRHIRVGRIEK